MTSAIVLPSLTNWVKQHLTALLKTTTQEDFDAAFNSFISQNVTITLNGKHLTRDQYKQQLQGEKFEESGALVNFLGSVEVSKDAMQASFVRSIPGIEGNPHRNTGGICWSFLPSDHCRKAPGARCPRNQDSQLLAQCRVCFHSLISKNNFHV